jgi:N6-adenosine-specific RNA methylase IME4
MNIIINEKLKSHIPPLRPDELSQLEQNILREGCKSPLAVWNGTLIDGHNRFEICTKHSLPFRIEEIDFPNFDAAIIWIEENQLGRRNLTTDQFAYFIGKKYERLKNTHGGHAGPRNSSGQNDHLKTSERIAAEHGTSEKAVRRAGEFAHNVDAIADAIGDQIRTEILGSGAFTRADVADIAKAIPEAKQEGLSFDSPKEALAWAKQHRAEKALASREERLDKLAEISKGNIALDTSQRYPVIYADPPWRYENPPMGGSNRSIENHYPTMSLEELRDLPVSDLAMDDAVLYMWATAPKLAECIDILRAWGFEYRTVAIWDKEVIGMGYHFRNQHELLLVGKRGSIPPPAAGTQPSSVYREKRGDHSAKPHFYYEMIEAAYPQLPKIELFCRSPRAGWSVWGNQSEAAA